MYFRDSLKLNLGDWMYLQTALHAEMAQANQNEEELVSFSVPNSGLRNVLFS